MAQACQSMASPTARSIAGLLRELSRRRNTLTDESSATPTRHLGSIRILQSTPNISIRHVSAVRRLNAICASPLAAGASCLERGGGGEAGTLAKESTGQISEVQTPVSHDRRKGSLP
jgi:hypothetical protein